MFNISVKGNVRCNGIVPPGTGGMVKRNVHINNNAMPPNRGHNIVDSKLKFSDRLKAYLSTDRIRSDTTTEVDDPYTFSDSEIVKPIVNNVAKKCLESKLKTDCVKNSKIIVVNGAASGVKSESVVASHGKTMSRLQAQIARNKVTVKHNRNSPDLKTEGERNTKRSIVVQNNVELKHSAVVRRLPPTGKPLPAALRARRASAKSTHHEGSIQRIPDIGQDRRWHAPQPYNTESTSDEDSSITAAVYQRHWFCRELELLSGIDGPREARLELTRSELKRHLIQMTSSRVGRSRGNQNALSLVLAARTQSRTATTIVHPSASSSKLLTRRSCCSEGCLRPALPCTRHCPMHIMKNSDQVLFDYCTAKFADNTQCSVPVFDITHELPLCTEHARKRDNYNKMCLETKPKKPRRKLKPSAMIRPQKRNKKRKRSQKSVEPPQVQTSVSRSSFTDVTEPMELNVCETSSAYESSEDVGLGTLSESEFVTIKEEEHHIGDQDVVEQVLAMQDEVVGDLELVTVEQALVTQASRLLEETDFTTVLNQIPADEFNDLFAVDRNGEYEPSREETEELERALEAVDEDVKSLEKLSQTQGLLDSLLDEHTLTESLVQIPDVFHNGYASVDPQSAQPTRALPPFHSVLHGVEGPGLPLQSQAHVP